MGDEFSDIVEAHQTIMYAEIGHNMWPLMQRAGPLLPNMMRERLVRGRNIAADDYLRLEPVYMPCGWRSRKSWMILMRRSRHRHRAKPRSGWGVRAAEYWHSPGPLWEFRQSMFQA